MSDPGQLAAEIARLQEEQIYWDAMRQKAQRALEDLPADSGMYTNNTREELKARLAFAVYQLQQIIMELNRLERERAELARGTHGDQCGRSFG
jgi:hypothetical protein